MKPHSVQFIIKETNVNFYTCSLIGAGFLSPIINKYLGLKLTRWVMRITDDAISWGPDMAEWFNLGQTIIDKLIKNTLDLDKLLLDHKKHGEILFKLCQRIEQSDIKCVTKTQIKIWLQKLWQHYIALSAVGFIPVISDFEHFYLTKNLTEVLFKQGVDQNKVQEYLSVLISPTISTLYWQEQFGLLNICRQSKSFVTAAKSPKLKRHIKKYQWLNYGYQGPIWQPQDFVNRIQRIFKHKQTVVEQYNDHRERLLKLKAQQKLLFKNLKLNQNQKRLFLAAQLFMCLKAYRVEVRHRVSYISDLLFTELSRRQRRPLSLFRYATREEILRLVDDKRVNEKEILQRRQGFVQIAEHGRFRFLPQKNVKKYLQRVLQAEEIATNSTVNGQVAFKGRVRGMVKIIYSINDLFKVNHGDILVAIATNPDFLPAMNKAIAFVTDTGGITSHAAIVAREMKKPCVIGTKIATKVLQDGDLVEVDAEKGIVRKLK